MCLSFSIVLSLFCFFYAIFFVLLNFIENETYKLG
jgi:hypothetical protein